jgi:transposase
MLADQLDYVVGVDPHRDSHALAVVQVVSGVVLFEATVAASSDGYAHALKLVDLHAPGRRAFAVEGTGSFRCWPDALPHRPRRAGTRGWQAEA